ncbi:uncharacterized protein K02A2.6-like [Ischnura elegans]|uniref:uncharacterized protein K02A2.6-like n=1 Tax=Ischnura elegans TaxID=197161 RepID=UPI001ED88035|nr:uncharacterized protein K02A2.6-like [Ischnura elegans]
MFGLKETDIRLRKYDNHIAVPAGEINVQICYNGICKLCRLIVVDGGTRSMFGRDLMDVFEIFKGNLLNYSLNAMNCNRDLVILIKKHGDLFKSELGRFKYEKASLNTNESVMPIFFKPPHVPFDFKAKIDEELDRLEKEGVISLVTNSEWGTPLVPVMQPDGRLRLCVDYKVTINRHLDDIKHPLPRIKELFAALQGGEYSTKLDFYQDYNQLELTDETKKLLTWSTHRGIFVPNRLPFGTKPACALF